MKAFYLPLFWNFSLKIIKLLLIEALSFTGFILLDTYYK